jgi:hypothetical protein
MKGRYQKKIGRALGVLFIVGVLSVVFLYLVNEEARDDSVVRSTDQLEVSSDQVNPSVPGELGIIDDLPTGVDIDLDQLDFQLYQEQKRRDLMAKKEEVNALPLEAVTEYVFTTNIDQLTWFARSVIFAPSSTIDSLLNDPYTNRLYQITQSGSDAERDWLSRELLDFGRKFVEELPDGPDFTSKDGWKSTQFTPGKGMIVPFLMASLDIEGEMLEPVLAMVNSRMESAPGVRERYHGTSVEGQTSMGEFEVVSAAAVYMICSNLEQRSQSDPNLQIAVDGFEIWKRDYTEAQLFAGGGMLELISAVQGESQ